MQYLSGLLLATCVLLPPAAEAQLPDQWWSRGAGGGGAFFSPAISPHNGNVLYVSTDMGVVFRSVNNGALWDTHPFGSLQGSRLSKVLFTSNPSVLYVLDGRVDYDDYYGGNVFKSIDGGTNWFWLSSDPAAGTDPACKKLRADPNRTDRLVLGHERGLWFSGNGGTNWTQFYSGSGCYLADVFFSGENIFAGGNFGVYVSSNNGGSFAAASLTGIGAGEGIVSFAGAVQNGRIRLYCITLDSSTASYVDDGYPSPAEAVYGNYAAYKGVYARDWPAGTWTRLTTGIAATHYPAFVATATNRTDVVYLAGQSDAEWPIVYRSTNAGTNWTSVFNAAQNQNVQTGWAGDQGDSGWAFGGGALGLEVSQSDPNHVLFSDLGYVHGTTNGGTTWQALYVMPSERNPANAYTPKHRSYHGIGLEDTTCWWLTWLDTNNVFASFTDIGAIRSTNAGASWIEARADVGNQNTIYCCVTNQTGTAYAAGSSVHDMYGSTRLQDNPLDGGSGQIFYSTNKAQSWAVLHTFGHPVVWLALHPTNQNVMYASVVDSTAGGIFVTSNLLDGTSSTWSRCTPPPRTEGHPLSIVVLKDGTLACTYSGRRDGTPVFTHSSGVFVSTDGGSSWIDRSVENMHCWTKDLVVYPFDSSQNTWFACVFNAWGTGIPANAGGLYRTTNRGQTWTPFTYDVWPALYRVASISFHPANTNFAFITTEDHGLLYSTNILATTPVFLLVTNYPFFQPMRVFTNPYDSGEIWATSVGNGLRVGWLAGARPVLAPPVFTNGLFNVSGTGRDGQRVLFEATTNFIKWDMLSTDPVLVVNGVFSDSDATALPFRFYRGRIASPVIGQDFVQPALAAPSWPNEPSGWTLIADTTWEAADTGAWTTGARDGWSLKFLDSTRDVSIDTVGDSVIGESRVLSHNYPPSHVGGGGVEPYRAIGGAYRQIYLGMYVQLSANFYGHGGSAINKLAYIRVDNSGVDGMMWIEYRFAGASQPVEPYLVNQLPNGGSGGIATGLTSGYPTRGTWHRVEVRLDLDTPRRVRYWVDGVLWIDNTTFAGGGAGRISEVTLSGISGGIGNAGNPSAQTLRYDRVRVVAN